MIDAILNKYGKKPDVVPAKREANSDMANIPNYMAKCNHILSNVAIQMLKSKMR